MGKLVTDHGPFVKLVSSGNVFVVPEYQRAYSWKAKKQVAELWGDISRLYRVKVSQGLETPHFIGSVVLGSATTKALASSECPVIDGQQRLITLSLIIAAIRDELVETEREKSKITSKYLASIDEEGAEIRLRPGVSDRAPFDAIILNEERRSKSSAVLRAYDFVVDQLRQGPSDETDPDEPGDETDVDADARQLESELDPLDEESETPPDDADDVDEEEIAAHEAAWDWNSLLSVVGTQLELVGISDVPPERAYQIFASLNSTGLPLAQIDLIRNAVFMLMPTKGKAAFRNHWTPMEKGMGKDLMEAYLHAWVIRRGHNVPAKEVYRSSVYELSRAGVEESDIEAVLKTWRTGAWSYMLLADPLGNGRTQFAAANAPTVPRSMKVALQRLRTWGTRPMEPVLLEILDRFRVKDFAARDVTRMLVSLESYAVRRFIVGTPPNDLRSIFARLTQQIRKSTTAASFEVALLSGLKEETRRWPSDEELTDALLTRPLYRKPLRQCFFVLKRLAEDLEGREAPQIVHGTGSADYSIEHVLPQNLTAAWYQDLSNWGDPDPQETWSKLRHTIGNLTLTAYNSELADSQFRHPASPTDKVRWIRHHLRLELSRTLLRKRKWTSAEIEERSKSLATLAVKIWPRDAP